MKQLLLLVVTVLIGIGIYSLSSNSELSFSEVEKVPRDVQENVDPGHMLQQIYKKDRSYVIFHSAGAVHHKLEVAGDEVNIMLTVSDEENEAEVRQHSYKLQMGAEHEKIAVFLNGELIPFDEVVVGL